MSSPTFPDPDPDAPEPDSGNHGAPDPPWSEEEDSAAYLGELMAAAAAGEELTAEDIAGAGFGEDGTAHQMRPGPVLATLVHAATTDEKILATLSDDDLVGVITAVRRIVSFAAWAELTAIREFATRPDYRRAPPAPRTRPPACRPRCRLGCAPGAASGAAPEPAPVAGAWMAVIPTRPSRACPATRRSASSRPRHWPRTCT